MASSQRAGLALDLTPLKALKKDTQQRAVTLKGVRAAGKVVQQAAKARAPKRVKSGALRQSMGLKAAKGKKGKTLAYAVVGARTKVVKMVPVGKSGRLVKAVPAKYAHLVEKGTRTAKAKPFLRPAFDASKDQAGAAGMKAMEAELAKIMAKNAAKLAGKK